MSKYNITGNNYLINKIQINKPKSASQSMLDYITSKSYSVLENKDATPILDESDYVVSFSSDKNTNYEGYLEVSKLLSEIFDFKPLSKEDWNNNAN